MRGRHGRTDWRGIGLAFLVAAGLVAAGQGQEGTRPPTREAGAKEADAKGADGAARTAKFLLDAFGPDKPTEAAEMLIAIARGSQLGPGEGWFHPGQTRYGWPWFARKHGVPPDGAIPRDKFQGTRALFARLDRNKDGELRAADFDWSDRSPAAMQAMLAARLFRRINKAADGRVTKEDLLKFFDEAADGKDHLTTDDVLEALTAGPAATAARTEGPKVDTLVRGLFRGEIGSMHEGPRLNDPAPDFSLRARDGKSTVRLGDLIGQKPVVLVFGNFTCGPFRASYPRVDAIARRYKDQAAFLAVYVREAHPTDGWRLGSNDDLGVALAQPRDYAERVQAANTCSTRLKMGLPLLVDEIDDRVGHAYSGMPARLYVIDQDGKIAYKSGRGPFGFKPGEMEQALVGALLDTPRTPAPPPTLADEKPAR